MMLPPELRGDDTKDSGRRLVEALPFAALALALLPAATLGLMAATQEATKGKFPMPSILISAFRAGNQRMHQEGGVAWRQAKVAPLRREHGDQVLVACQVVHDFGGRAHEARGQHPPEEG